ncbi:hypothetical protein DFH06DRAFT_1134500 [Mycena polygramma]|nr:hypothetical protein DFH06DRAFT_1134500 [Mycena polygramma]
MPSAVHFSGGKNARYGAEISPFSVQELTINNLKLMSIKRGHQARECRVYIWRPGASRDYLWVNQVGSLTGDSTKSSGTGRSQCMVEPSIDIQGQASVKGNSENVCVKVAENICRHVPGFVKLQFKSPNQVAGFSERPQRKLSHVRRRRHTDSVGDMIVQHSETGVISRDEDLR